MAKVTMSGCRKLVLAGVEFCPGEQDLSRPQLAEAQGVMVDTKFGPRSYLDGLMADGHVVVEGVNDAEANARKRGRTVPDESQDAANLRAQLTAAYDKIEKLEGEIIQLAKKRPAKKKAPVPAGAPKLAVVPKLVAVEPVAKKPELGALKELLRDKEE